MKQIFLTNRIILVSILTILLSFSCNKKTEVASDDTNMNDSALIDTSGESLDIEENAENLVENKDSSKLNKAQFQVQKLLESCVKKDYKTAASTIMYRGADASRMWKESFNYSNANEANTVKVTCDVIINWLGNSKDYEFISYKEEESDHGTMYVVEIMFKKQKVGLDRHFFYLMDTPKGMLLVNMI